MKFILQQLLNIFRIPAEDKHCCRYSLSYLWAIALMTASSKRVGDSSSLALLKHDRAKTDSSE